MSGQKQIPIGIPGLERRMKYLDIVSSIIIIVLAGVAMFWLIPNHVPTRHDPGDLPPNLMPMLSAGVLAFTGILLGISAWRKKDFQSDDQQNEKALEKIGFGFKEFTNLVILMLASAVYLLVLKHAGFEVASGLLMATAMLYAGLRNIWIIAGVSIVMPVLIVQVAWHTLNIQLP